MSLLLRCLAAGILLLTALPAWPQPDGRSSGGQTPGAASERLDAARQRMVERDLAQRGIRDPAVLDAMRRVPRHLFVPPAIRERAYEDRPLPIGLDQTISQPFIVAYMTE